MKDGHKIMFHVKHLNPRYSDKNRETFIKYNVKHSKIKMFHIMKPQYIGVSIAIIFL